MFIHSPYLLRFWVQFSIYFICLSVAIYRIHASIYMDISSANKNVICYLNVLYLDIKIYNICVTILMLPKQHTQCQKLIKLFLK